MPNEPATQKLRWFHPTPGKLLVVLLAVEGLLLLSERFKWFGFNEHKGWTVLIVVAAVGLFLLLMLLWFIAGLLFRWRFQFSIRSLLLLTLAVAIPCSWLAVELKWARKQKEMVEAVVKATGTVGYDFEDSHFRRTPRAQPPGPIWFQNVFGEDFFWNVTYITFPHSLNMEHPAGFTDAELKEVIEHTQLRTLDIGDTQVTDAGLEYLKECKQLRAVSLDRNIITDVGLKHLKGLEQLRTLSLEGTQITDAGLEQLKGLEQLQVLRLPGTHITGAGLEQLKGLKQLRILELWQTQITDAGLKYLVDGSKMLETLDLSENQITDAGLEHLKGLTALPVLVLDKTNITDAGLQQLSGLKELQYLYLRGTQITDEAIAELRKALPNCKISH